MRGDRRRSGCGCRYVRGISAVRARTDDGIHADGAGERPQDIGRRTDSISAGKALRSRLPRIQDTVAMTNLAAILERADQNLPESLDRLFDLVRIQSISPEPP